jgi:hypothetical protein
MLHRAHSAMSFDTALAVLTRHVRLSSARPPLAQASVAERPIALSPVENKGDP